MDVSHMSFGYLLLCEAACSRASESALVPQMPCDAGTSNSTLDALLRSNFPPKNLAQD